MITKRQIWLTYFIGLMVLILSMFYFSFWKTNSFKMGDAWGYYAYLPATFIHQDLENLDSSHVIRSKYAGLAILDKKDPFYYREALIGPKGKPVIKYTYGIALLESPFFFMGHIFAKITHTKQDGYSMPYIIALHVGNFLYILTGLLLLYASLLQWFTKKQSLVTVLLIALVTNLLYFSLFNTGMVHGYLFFLYALLIFSTIQFYAKPNFKKASVLAILCSLIVVIRPTEILCLFIPFLYGCGTLPEVKIRFTFWLKKFKWVLAGAVIAIVIAFPQFLYWKYQTGFWLYDSYPIEHFNFLRPEILNGIFSFKNGWLIYTPIMLMALVGLFFIKKKVPQLAYSIVIIFVLHVYIIYCWWSWQYVNGYGSRPMIQIYPLLSFALATVIAMVSKQKWFIQLPFVLFILICTVLNWVHLLQMEAGTLLTEDGTYNLYKASLGKFTSTRKMMYAYDNNLPYADTVGKEKLKTIDFTSFEEKDAAFADSVKVYAGKKSQHLTTQEFGITFSINGTEKVIEKGMYLQFKLWMWLPENHGLYENVLMVITKEAYGKTELWNSIRVENKNPDTGGYSFWWGKQQTWVPVDFTMKIEDDVSPNTIFKCFVWNPRQKEIFIDDASAVLWRDRN